MSKRPARAVGALIARARRDAGLTQEAVARLAGISPASTLGQLECGYYWPSVQRLLAIAKAIGCMPADLLPDA